MSEGAGRFNDPWETEILLPYLPDGVKLEQSFSARALEMRARVERLSVCWTWDYVGIDSSFSRVQR